MASFESSSTTITIFTINHQKKFALGKSSNESGDIFVSFSVASKAGVKLTKKMKLCVDYVDGEKGPKAVLIHRDQQATPAATVSSPQQHKKPTQRQHTVFSMDIEAVATGKSHLHEDRSPATVSIVNSNCEVVLELMIRPDLPVVSYLTPLTGIDEGDLDNGVTLEEAIQQVRGVLGPSCVLVGQRVQGDVDWMQLREGTDYASIIDLAESFAATLPNGNKRYYNLKHEARVVLGTSDNGAAAHSATEDAIISMRLHNWLVEHRSNPKEFKKVLGRLRNTKQEPTAVIAAGGVSAPCWNGVCMSGYNKDFCTCGQPTYGRS